MQATPRSILLIFIFLSFNVTTLEIKAESGHDAAAGRIERVGSFRIGHLHLVEAEEIDATHIDLGFADELDVIQHRLGQIVVGLHIAQLEERAVDEPERAVAVVVGTALV